LATTSASALTIERSSVGDDVLVRKSSASSADACRFRGVAAEFWFVPEALRGHAPRRQGHHFQADRPKSFRFPTRKVGAPNMPSCRAPSVSCFSRSFDL
jgi:hypothetical protein